MGLKDLFRSQPKSSAPETPTELSMLMLDPGVSIDVHSLLTELLPLWSQVVPGLQISASAEGGAASNATTKIVAIRVDAPIPWPELEISCRISPWRDAAQRLRGHAAHLVIATKSSDRGPQDRVLLHVKIVSSIVKRFAIAGVHCTATRQVYDCESYRAMARASKREDIALPLAVSVLGTELPEGLLVYTMGLARFDRMEIEAYSKTVDRATLRALVMSTASQVVRTGLEIRPGESVGFRAGVGGQTSHAPSQMRKGLKVLRVDVVPSIEESRGLAP